MAELAHRADFHDVGLDLNYRSGVNIIRASEAALGHNRGRSPAPGLPPGEVVIARVGGALDEHAAEVVRVVHDLFDQGVPAERIGILYPSRGPVLEAVLEQLALSELPYLYERDEALPTGTLSRLIQRCASRAVVNGQIHLTNATSKAAAEDVIRRTQAPTVLDLERDLLSIRREAGLVPPPSRLHLARELQRSVDTPASTSDDIARPWLAALIDRLDLGEISVRHPDRDNARALSRLEALVEGDEYTIADLAAGVEVVGKLMLTTYHSAKGRQFRAVILPGLVNGLVPRQINVRGNWRTPIGAELDEQRRAFFVAVSRAESYAHLITGPGYFTTNGYWRSDGPSDFVVAVEAAIASSA
jgi:DNA helicase-2/ATP-dependent DNA helicase PcrA